MHIDSQAQAALEELDPALAARIARNDRQLGKRKPKRPTDGEPVMTKAQAIEALGGTQAAASEAVGITQQAVSRWPLVLSDKLRDRVQAVLYRQWRDDLRRKINQQDSE